MAAQGWTITRATSPEPTDVGDGWTVTRPQTAQKAAPAASPTGAMNAQGEDEEPELPNLPASAYAPPTRYGQDASGKLVSKWNGTGWVDLYNGKKVGAPAREELGGQTKQEAAAPVTPPEQPKPQPQAVAPAGATPGAWGRLRSAFNAARQVAGTHSIQALGGSTATELWDRAGQSAKSLIESTLGEPWERTRANLPGPAKTAEFLYHASKIVPGVLDFLYTPTGAAVAAGLPIAPASVQAGAGAAFSTDMARGTGEAYQRYKANPSPSTAGDLVGSAAMTALPMIHAAGTEYGNRVREAYQNYAKTQPEVPKAETPVTEDLGNGWTVVRGKPAARVADIRDEPPGAETPAVAPATEAPPPAVESLGNGWSVVRQKQAARVADVQGEAVPETSAVVPVPEAQAAPVAPEAAPPTETTIPALRPVESPAMLGEREPGWIGNISRGEVEVDAPRFQFKQNVGQGGVSDEFREVTKWDPEKAGILSVWRDPANGRTYAINGHHRVDMANRAENAPDVLPVRYLDARTAQEARTKGALINISEGRGESTDAAKVFRDMQFTPEDRQVFEKELGKGKIATEGMALSKLSQPIFDDVMSGELSPARGAVLGAGIENHADQRAVYDLMKQREKGGKRLTNDQIGELIRLNNGTPTITESTADQSQGGLFGVEEMTRSLLPEKAEVSDYIRKQLSTEKKLFGTVSTQAAAERLGEGGNIIRAGENAQTAERANQGILLYDKLSTKAGSIAQILDRAAQSIADGENAGEVKQRSYKQIRDALRAQADQLAGVQAVSPEGSAGLSHGAGTVGAAAEGHAAANGQESLVTPKAEADSRAADQQGQDRLLHDQLTAQLRSGGPVKPTDLKPAENRDLFTASQPEAGGLFGSERGSFSTRQLPPEPPYPPPGRTPRNESLAAFKKALDDPSDKQFGERLRTYVTGERDARIAATNQLRDDIQRALRDPVDRQALTLMRDFKGREGEMRQFIEGTHKAYKSMDADEKADAVARIQKLAPIIERAQNPTPAMKEVDQMLTEFSREHRTEGQRLGVLRETSIPDENYITHVLTPKEPSEAQKAKVFGPKLGPRNFKFAKERTIPTVLDAVAYGAMPRTLDASDALTVYGEKYGKSAAARILARELGNADAGKWGFSSQQKGENATIPANWVELGADSRLYRNDVPVTDKEGNAHVAHQQFFVPPEVNEALRPILSKDALSGNPLARNARIYQAYIKSMELSLSVFHMKALNVTGLNNEGVEGLIRTYQSDMKSPGFEQQERNWIRAGLQTSILGRTIEAYRALGPGSPPSLINKIRALPGLKQADRAAAATSRLTFDVIQRKLKVVDASLKDAAWLAKHPKATGAEHFEAQRQIAKEVNAAYGGLNWENMGIDPTSLGIARLALLAPDWTFSNLASAKYATEKGAGGDSARAFWLRSAVTGVALTQGLSLILGGKLSKDPTQVYMGKDKNGGDVHQNMFFVGAPGDAVNLIRNSMQYGVPGGPAATVFNKLGPFAKTAVHLGMKEDALGRSLYKKNDSLPQKTWAATKQAASDLAPVPFGATSIMRMMLDKSGKYGPQDYVSTAINSTSPRHEAPAKPSPEMRRLVRVPAHGKGSNR